MRWCEDYVNWYNNDHHHSALAGFTPQQVFTGEYVEVAKVRQAALDEAFIKYPQRFSKGQPMVQMPPQEVCINPIPEDADQKSIEKGVNFPTHPRAIEKQVNY